MEQKKNFLSLFLIMIISSFLIGGCYTQLERPGVQVGDEENEYYSETADSEYADEEYEEYADDSAVPSDVQYNYYFYDSPYHYSYYPNYYRPFNRFDALLYFDYYDTWLNYYTWWPVAGYTWWPAYSMYSYYNYDPWGYRSRNFSPYWWDRNYYASGRGYVAAHVPQKQRPFIGQGPTTRTFPRGAKDRTDIQPVSKKRFIRHDASNIQKTSKRTADTRYTRSKVRNDQTTRKAPARTTSLKKSKRSDNSVQTVRKTRGSTSSRDKVPANVRSKSRSSSSQGQTSAQPSRSSSSTPKRSAAQPTRRSSPPPQRSSNSGGSSRSSGSSKSSSSSSKSSNDSKKKSK